MTMALDLATLDSPIQRLAPELLSTVFVHYVEDESDPPMLELGYVCRFWWWVLLSTPSLWSRVKVSAARRPKRGFLPIEQVSHWVRRAGAHPLDVLVDLDFEDNEEAVVDAEDSNGVELAIVGKVFAFLADHHPKHLHISNTRGDVSMRTFLDKYLQPHLASNKILASLTLDIPEQNDCRLQFAPETAVRFHEALSKSPSLQSLDVPAHLAPLYVTTSDIPISQNLRHLCVNQPPPPEYSEYDGEVEENEDGPVAGPVISLSDRVSTLTSLKLGRDAPLSGLYSTPEHLPSVTLPLLEDLHVANWDDLEILLHKLHVPNLRKLRLSHFHSRIDTSTGLSSFINSHGDPPKLETLILDMGVEFHERSLLSTIKRLPTLVELRLPSTNLTKTFVSTFTTPASVGSPWLCPKLQVLVIGHVDVVESQLTEADMEDLVRVRVHEVGNDRELQGADVDIEPPARPYVVKWGNKDMI
ncbi:hypothetical protein FRB94_013078 [Tulasnella sp. JGI-2019a]|nr:hypothetical protein FRB94_013078 [Tulasnella sp. JGI-2019a]KAG9033863.1 hypothetical protein FRB95_014185 [Tulasnella sp. JGI-2019a]